MEPVFTLLFTVDFVIQFFVEYKYPSSTVVERDLRKLCWIYLNGRFIFDFLSIFPFYRLVHNMSHEYNVEICKLFYLIKLSRLYNGFSLINYKMFMREYKLKINDQIQKIM